MHGVSKPPQLRDYDEKIAEVRREKESAIDSQDFEKASALRDEERQLIAAKDSKVKEWTAKEMDVVLEVTEGGPMLPKRLAYSREFRLPT